jgi:thiamine-monophosphate kinase
MRENDLIAWLQRRHGVTAPGTTGIGDDCCTWRASGEVCLSVDAIVEGVHFLTTDSDADVGMKAAGAALSDLAAMGADPVGAAVILQVGPGRDARSLMAACGDRLVACGCPLLGGDTVSAPATALGVTVWGRPGPAGRLIRRRGAVAGDRLVVTGALGGSLASGRHLRPEPRLAEGRWLAAQGSVRAMMDLSDGLAADAAKLATASGLGCRIAAGAVPRHPDTARCLDPLAAAFVDGEDFELLLAVDPAGWDGLARAWPFTLSLTAIGELIAGTGVEIEDAQGRRQTCPYAGYEHRLG